VPQAYPVTAAVGTQFRSSRDSTAKPEDAVQDVEDERDDWVEGDALLQRRWDEVEKCEHAEDGHEEVVVDDAVVARVPLLDHVTGQRHDEESPEELFIHVRSCLAVGVLLTVSNIRQGLAARDS